MATLNEIAYNIKNLAEGGIGNRASNLSIRQLRFMVRYHRSALIPKYIRQTGRIHPQLLQDMGCVTLTTVDQAECKDYNWGENVKKTSLPKLVALPTARSLTYIGKVNKREPFSVVPADLMYLQDYKKFTANDPRVYIIGDTVYVDLPEGDDLCVINIRGIFEDPEDVPVTDEDGNTVCLDADDEYPITEELTQMVTDAILRKELGIFLQTETLNDKTNNSQDDGADNKR